jgi:uncharacterized protein GlcG (DUF336 family)
MMTACKAEASKNKWNVAISIVDGGGCLLRSAIPSGVKLWRL